MNGIFQIPKLNEKIVNGFVEDLREKGLKVYFVWMKNGKEVGRYEGKMPTKANRVQIYIGNQSIIDIYKNTGTFDDSTLNDKEIETVVETLIQNGWVKKPDIGLGMFFSLLHFALIVIFMICKWDESSRLITLSLGLTTIVLITTAILLWYPRVKRGLKYSPTIMLFFCLGIFISVPVSMLQLVLFKAFQKETFYISAAKLFPDLLIHYGDTKNGTMVIQ